MMAEWCSAETPKMGVAESRNNTKKGELKMEPQQATEMKSFFRHYAALYRDANEENRLKTIEHWTTIYNMWSSRPVNEQFNEAHINSMLMLSIVLREEAILRLREIENGRGR